MKCDFPASDMRLIMVVVSPAVVVATVMAVVVIVVVVVVAAVSRKGIAEDSYCSGASDGCAGINALARISVGIVSGGAVRG